MYENVISIDVYRFCVCVVYSRDTSKNLSLVNAIALSSSDWQLCCSANRAKPRQLEACSCLLRKLQQAVTTEVSCSKQAVASNVSTVFSRISMAPGKESYNIKRITHGAVFCISTNNYKCIYLH